MTEVRPHAASRAAGEAALIYRAALDAGHATLAAAERERLLAAAGLQLAPAPANAVELSVRVHATREFGLVLSAGAGGLDGALDAANFARDRAAVHAAVELTDGTDFIERFKRTIAWQRIAALCTRRGLDTPSAALSALFDAVLQLAAGGHPEAEGAQVAVQELTLECACDGATLAIVAAHCSVGAPPVLRVARPLHKIDRLLHPQRIGIVGASATGMNFGRIILRNLLGSGCTPERLCVIRPGGGEIDGVGCIENLAAIEGKLDLLIVAVAADAVYPLVDEIIATNTVEAVMLIPGGLGETAKSREPAAALAARINAAHAHGDGGPIFVGANCLGVVSHPGRYDSWFIPLERLPKPQKLPERRAVMLSQSGAFMITRLSHNPWLDPRYMIAIGNQTDITHGDLLSWFAGRDDIDTIGIYVEGFRDLDGLAFAHAVRRAVLAGKQVVVYKSGRSEAGQAGVMGHTASIAGNPVLFASVLTQAGASVTDNVEVFDDLFYMAGALHAKHIGGDRLAAASGAGFEAVSAADSIVGETFSMRMAALEADTVRRIEAVLAEKKLAALVEVRNPLDMNPGADDDAHVRITAAMAEDPNVDAVVVGLDPTAPMVRALEQSRLRPGYDLADPESTVHTLPPLVARSAKPIVAVVDAGRLYDAMAAALMDQGVCVFRNVARGTRALVRHVEARLDAERLRRHFGRS
ncbi:CoA-binding protein [Thauera sp.]|jgi:acyl-CoA synthetase (NDP forming)|uniref:CoA-binding protein n=1 Tax=Thauera sp. TaxID=1905334 RepID=UPI002610289F|nr:CoA-binding protein [Thauera sp.]MCK6409013.1 CoA-binding protein [Thauera sp.]